MIRTLLILAGPVLLIVAATIGLFTDLAWPRYAAASGALLWCIVGGIAIHRKAKEDKP